MVAKVIPIKGVRNALHYNENKVKQGVAQLIHSMGFGKDTEDLGFSDKMGRFEKLMALNERTQFNTLHISLNFDPSENPDKETLRQIADAYMEKIGFGKQPFLVYQHHDAGHNHIHIVTTNIQANGKAINLHNIGRNQSTQARKEIEQAFKLVVADKRQEKLVHEIRPVSAQKVQYGKTSTKRAITNVLDAVIKQYKYTSLAELNAVLRLYNVVADRGSEDSRTFQRGGLVFRVLDENGKKIGAPIKASAIYSKPTLKVLEELFLKNEPLRQPHKLRIKNAVDLAILNNKGGSLQELEAALKKEKITLVVRRNEQGVIYGLTYIDHSTKTVFNGSDLGKIYSANQLLQRLLKEPAEQQQEKQQKQKVALPKPSQSEHVKRKQTPPSGPDLPTPKQTQPVADKQSPVSQAINELFQPEQTGMNSELLRDQQKKRRKKLRH